MTEYVPTFKTVVVGDAHVGKTSFLRRHRTGVFNAAYEPTMGAKTSNIDFTMIPTEGKEATKVRFDCWDVAGIAEYGGFRGGYFAATECLMVFYDVTSRESFLSIPRLYNEVMRFASSDGGELEEDETIPVVLVGTNGDLKGCGTAEAPSPAEATTEGAVAEGANDSEPSSSPSAPTRAVDFEAEVAKGLDGFEPAMAAFLKRHLADVRHVEVSSLEGTNLEEPFLVLARAVLGDSTVAFAPTPAKAPPAPVAVDMAAVEAMEAALMAAHAAKSTNAAAAAEEPTGTA